MRRTTLRAFNLVTAVALSGPALARGQLPPSAFPNLPPPIRKELERRGCSIPQVPGDTTPRNILQAHLRRSKQLDWAVLCSVAGYPSILVFWSGASPQRPSEVAVATDVDYTEVLPDGRKVFLRAIERADSATIPNPQPVPVEHDGISNIHLGRSSLIYYWDDVQKRWVPLRGAD